MGLINWIFDFYQHSKIEDARQEAASALVETAVRKTLSYLCKPSAKKWEKQIREARRMGPAD